MQFWSCAWPRRKRFRQRVRYTGDSQLRLVNIRLTISATDDAFRKTFAPFPHTPRLFNILTATTASAEALSFYKKTCTHHFHTCTNLRQRITTCYSICAQSVLQVSTVNRRAHHRRTIHMERHQLCSRIENHVQLVQPHLCISDKYAYPDHHIIYTNLHHRV